MDHGAAGARAVRYPGGVPLGARRCLPVVAALLAVIAPAAVARADRRPVLLLDGTADGSGAGALEPLAARLVVEDELGPVSFEMLSALSKAPPVDDSWQVAASAALAAAKDDLARFGYSEAATRARAATDRLAPYAELPAARALIAELTLVEGMALVLSGEVGQAEHVLRLVHRFDPGRSLDPARYLPEVIGAYLAAGRAPEQTGTLQVSAPGAAQVLIDGVAVGVEPALVEVAPGPHLVAVHGEVITVVGRRVTAAAGETVRVDLTPVVAPFPVRVARALARLRSAADDAAMVDAITTLLGLAQARDAVVVVPAADGLRLRLYTVRGGLGPPRPIDRPASTLAPLRPLPVVVRPPERPPSPRPPIELEPWYQRPWGKTALGVGVATVVAGVVTAMVLREPGTSTFIGQEGR